MKKKNSLPLKWMLGALIVLTAVVYGTHEASKNMLMAQAASNVSSHSNFFQFLANIFGIHLPGSSGGPLGENNPSAPTHPGFGPTGSRNTGNQPNLNPISPENGSISQGTAQKGNNAVNNAEINSESNAEFNTKSSEEMSIENNPENNVEINAENNQELNAEESGNISGINAETNAEINDENSPGNSTENNSEVNADQESGNLAELNAENNPENNQGESSGDNSGGNSGENDNNLGNNPGSSSANINPTDLPTINPIPTDNAVSRNIAKQNQQNDSLASLLAARQALVLPVQQQAQASKYQTVNSQSIPAPSTNQPPADAVAKIKSNQVVISH